MGRLIFVLVLISLTFSCDLMVNNEPDPKYPQYPSRNQCDIYNNIKTIKSAIDSGNLDAVKCFVNENFGFSIHKSNALYYAVENFANIRIIQYLVNYGFYINEKNKKNQTPLDIAIENNMIDAIYYLKSKGAKEGLDSYNLCLDSIVFYARQGDLEKVRCAFEKDPSSIFSQDIDKKTALHYAAGNSFEIAKYLINHNADINKLDDQNRTPLYYAIRNNNFNTVKLLFNSGALIDKAD